MEVTHATKEISEEVFQEEAVVEDLAIEVMVIGQITNLNANYVVDRDIQCFAVTTGSITISLDLHNYKDMVEGMEANNNKSLIHKDI